MILGKPVRDRLAARLPLAREIGDAATVADAMESARVLPALYVLPASETAERSERSGSGLRQIVQARIAVLCGVNLRGRDASDVIETWRDDIKLALIGWRPSPDHDLIQYAGYDLLAINGPAAFFQLQFTTSLAEYSGTPSG